MYWKVTTSPTTEPISLAEAKLHLRVDHSTDDDLITDLIKVAREWCEAYEGRAYMTQTITAYMDRFCGDVIALPHPPLLDVSSVKYQDVGDTQQTLSTSIYNVDTTAEPGRIILAYSKTWPTTLPEENAIEIVYTAGYNETADNTDDVPSRVKSAIKLIVGHLYENRENSIVGVSAQNIPMGAKSLLFERVFYAGR
jgi:uncharacterized phiE125 gp8 family phage protein